MTVNEDDAGKGRPERDFVVFVVIIWGEPHTNIKYGQTPKTDSLPLSISLGDVKVGLYFGIKIGTSSSDNQASYHYRVVTML